MRKMKAARLRAIVVVAVVLLVAVGYFTAVGIGNPSAFGWDAFAILCPLGYLASLVASKVFVPRALVSFLIAVALIVVLGRAFCAWVCPFPLLQRWIPGLGRKKVRRAVGNATPEAVEGQKGVEAGKAVSEGVLPEPASTKVSATAVDEAGSVAAPAVPTEGRTPDSRLLVLLGALASAAVFGFPVFCLICPVGLTFAAVFLVMRLFAFGEVTWTIVAVAAVLLIEVVFFRKWCKKFCPLGALVSLLSRGNKTLRPTIDDQACNVTAKGVPCFACSKACPEELDVRRPELSKAAASNCTKCRECAQACPTHAITFPLVSRRRCAQPDRVGAPAADAAAEAEAVALEGVSVADTASNAPATPANPSDIDGVGGDRIA